MKNINMYLRTAVLLLFTNYCLFLGVSAQDKPEIFVQSGCLGKIYKVCLSQDEKSMLTISSTGHDPNFPEEGIMKLWDVETGKEILTFEGRHYKSINSVCFSADGKYILTSSDDKTIKLWNANTGKEINSYTGIHNSLVRALVITPDSRYALSLDNDKNIKKWDILTGAVSGTYSMIDNVSNISLSADGNLMLSSSIDGNVKLWSLPDMKELKSYQTHIKGSDEFYDLAPFQSMISADGKYALMAARFSFELMDLTSGKKVLIQSTQKLGLWIESVIISSDNKFIFYTIANRSAIYIYSVEKKEDIKKIPIQENKPMYLFRDGKRLIYNSSKDKYGLTLWDIEKESEIRSFVGHIPRQIDNINLLDSGQSFLISNRQFNKWTLNNGPSSSILSPNMRDNRFVERGENSKDAISPDEQYSIYSNYSSVLWNIKSNKFIAILKDISSINCASFSPDGTWVAVGSMQGLSLWKMPYILSKVAEKGKPLEISQHSYFPLANSVNSICFSPDGKFIITGDKTGKLTKWSMGTDQNQIIEVKSVFEGHTKNINNVSFSKDGTFVLSASNDNTIKQWDFSSGKLLNTFSGHNRYVRNAVFSTHGNYILSGSEDKTVRLWDVATGKILKTLKGHTNGVSSVCFLPDEKYVLSCSYDGTVRLWDIFEEKEIAMFVCFEDGEWICVTPNGYYTASANGAQYVNIRIGNIVHSLSNFADKYYRQSINLFSCDF